MIKNDKASNQRKKVLLACVLSDTDFFLNMFAAIKKELVMYFKIQAIYLL